MFDFAGTPDGDKIIAARLERLKRVFDFRHNFIHETDVLDLPLEITEDPLVCVSDALWLISQFQKQYDHIEMTPKYSVIKEDEGLQDEIGRNLKDIDDAFERIKQVSNGNQFEKLEAFKKVFVEFLWAQCDYQASIFISQQSESSMSFFLDLAPQYQSILRDIALKQRFMRGQYTLERQYADIGLTADGSLPPEFEVPEGDSTR